MPCAVCWALLRLHCCSASVSLTEQECRECQGQKEQHAHDWSCCSGSQSTSNRVLGADTQCLSRAQMELCASLPLQEGGGRESQRLTPFSLFPSLLQHCIWAKLKSICIWEAMYAVVGVTGKEDGRVPYVLLHCRFYSFLEICSKILLISCPKNLVVFCTWSFCTWSVL